MYSTKGLKTDRLTKEKILELIPEYSLWCYYTGLEIKLGRKYLSPVRQEKDPSAVFFVSSTGNILLKDFGGEVWSFWKFIKSKCSNNLLEAFKRIDLDFGLGYYTGEKYRQIEANELRRPFIVPEYEKTKFFVKRKKWNHYELEYWGQYNISKETLDFFNIHPLKTYWIAKKNNLIEFRRKTGELLFLFSFGGGKYKIYRPKSNKKVDKWLSNCTSDDLMGLDNLPEIGDSLLILKGMKELCISKEAGFNGVSLQGENSYPSLELENSLKKRFKDIYYIPDKDDPGQKAAEYIQKKYNLKIIQLPNIQGVKDLADFSKLKGIQEVKNMINLQL